MRLDTGGVLKEGYSQRDAIQLRKGGPEGAGSLRQDLRVYAEQEQQLTALTARRLMTAPSFRFIIT